MVGALLMKMGYLECVLQEERGENMCVNGTMEDVYKYDAGLSPILGGLIVSLEEREQTYRKGTKEVSQQDDTDFAIPADRA